MKFCNVDGCENKHVAKGYCGRHYMNDRRHGDPEKSGTPKGAVQKFFKYAAEFTGSDCLIWPYAFGSVGYGKLSGPIKEAHQAVCTRAHGPRPSRNHDATHNCGNRACVNPTHLRWATRRENLSDMKAHGTKLEGEKAPWSKLTADAVRFIRRNRGVMKQKQIAEILGIGQSQVSSIQRRVVWRSVE